jgi:hypothetical protein
MFWYLTEGRTYRQIRKNGRPDVAIRAVLTAMHHHVDIVTTVLIHSIDRNVRKGENIYLFI